MKKVTVLTLSYNSPDLLAAVDSVLKQTYEDIQYILVDDGSERFDKGAILKHIAENNRGNVQVEIFVNEENLGIIKSSNIGLSHAEGDYVINLAGDDCFYDENVVADIVAEYERTGAMALTGYRHICDLELNETGRLLPSKREVYLIQTLEPKELFEKMAICNFIFGCCTSYSKECFEKFGFYDETYRNIDDYSMNMKLLRQGVQIKFFERVFVKYRSGGVSALANIKESYLKEEEQIFEDEIEPYVKDARRTRKRYEEWKKRRVIDKKYAQALERYQGQAVMVTVVKCVHYFIHPKIFMLALREKINLLR